MQGETSGRAVRQKLPLPHDPRNGHAPGMTAKADVAGRLDCRKNIVTIPT